MSDKSDLYAGAGLALVILAIGSCNLMDAYGRKLTAETAKIDADIKAKQTKEIKP